MSRQSFKVDKSLRLRPVDLTTLTNPENGELAIDASDSNRLKKYNETTSAWELIEGSGTLPSNVVLTNAVQTLTNKSLVDSSTAIVDATDATKQLKFDAAGTTATSTTLATSQTANRILTLPDATGTLISSADVGTVTSTMIADGTIVNADIASNAAIALSKLATGLLPSGITVNSSNIVDGSIVDADISSSAAIALSKLATGALPTGITVTSSNIVDGTIVDADISSTAAISLSKLATGALPTAITVTSANIVDGTIVDADISSTAAIALSKLATGALPTGITVTSSNIVDGSIVNADISSTAAIDRTKLATGTPYYVLANDASGVMTSNTSLQSTSYATSILKRLEINHSDSDISGTNATLNVSGASKIRLTNSSLVSIADFSNIVMDNIYIIKNDTGNDVTIQDYTTSQGTNTKLRTMTGNDYILKNKSIIILFSASTPFNDDYMFLVGAEAVATIAAGSITSSMIADGTIVNADISPTANIALSKLATGALPTGITVTSSNIVDGTIVDADISSSAAISLSKLATGALPTGITVTSGNIVNGTIVDEDISSTAAIALSKLATGTLPSGITIGSSNISDGSIMNSDINANAAIDATKIANGTVSNTEFQYLDGVTSSIQTQLNGKEPTITAGTTSQYWRGDKTWQTLNLPALSDVSLSTLSNGQVLTYNGTTGKWENATPSSGSSKEIHEHATINDFPATGTAENIYVAKDTNNLYRWDVPTLSYIQEATNTNSILTEVFNESGITIPKMSVIYLNGRHGDIPVAQLAQADSELHSALTYGLVLSDIADMERGYVVELGRLSNLNTDIVSWNEGDILYLSPSVAGGVTNVKPTAPNHMVIIGTLVRKHITQGIIQVKVQNGYELGELHNVSLSNPPSNGDYLVYDTSTSLWKNSSLDLSGYIKKDGSVAMEANLSMGSTPHKVTNLANGTANSDAVNLSQLKDPTNITQDSTHRFVTDTQISTWDAKQNALGYTPENVANKVTNLTSANNTTYPTSLAVSNALSGKFDQPTGTTSQYIRGDGSLATLPSTTWGSITGTLANQTDLKNALDLKEDLANKATDFTTINNTKYPTIQAVSTELAKKRDVYISGENTADLTHYTTNDICRIRQTKKITGLTFTNVVSYENILRSLDCSASGDFHTKLIIFVKGIVNSNTATAMFIKDIHVCNNVMVSYQDSFTSQNDNSLIADLQCDVFYENEAFVLGFICKENQTMSSCTVSVFMEEEQF